MQTSEKRIEEEDTVSDYHCSVCYSVFFQPITTPDCKHTFCRQCLSKVLETQNTCPLCRNEIGDFIVETAQENEKISSEVKAKFPSEYEERVEEWNKYCELAKYLKTIQLKVGNEHVNINGKNNSHLWTLYIRDLDNVIEGESILPLIQKVEVQLHPTFRPSKLTLGKAPFEVQRAGWGIFSIEIKVFFKPQLKIPPIETSHLLNFTRNDTFKVHKVKADLRLLEQVPQEVEAGEQGDEIEETDIQRRANALQRLMWERFNN